jgi:glycosyltransferase involved in cell wall biosynthesis
MFQFLPRLREFGFVFEKSALLPNDYVTVLYGRGRYPKARLISAYGARLRSILRLRHSFDLLWVEKELFPWLPGRIESSLLASGPPVIVDLDDAVFHRYDLHGSALVRIVLGRKIDVIMRCATTVVAGNDYIAQRALRSGARRIAVMPSAVDTSRFRPLNRPDGTGCHIGWIGTPVTAQYLEMLREPLRSVADRHPLRITLIGAPPLTLAEFQPRILEWNELSEIEHLNEFDIGVMPLFDGPLEQGKCGYKLIQYMACGRPVVATPVGVNQRIVTSGRNGFLASTSHDWILALDGLAKDPDLRCRMGSEGRALVEAEYSVDRMAAGLAGIFNDAIGRSSAGGVGIPQGRVSA